MGEAHLADPGDDQRALEAGADDYVTKPFGFRELIARLGAVLRRTRAVREASGVLQARDLKLDPDRRLLWKKGEQVRLSPKEFDLLTYLMKNQGVPITHIKLLRAMWGSEYGGELEYLRSYVRMLRKKSKKIRHGRSIFGPRLGWDIVSRTFRAGPACRFRRLADYEINDYVPEVSSIGVERRGQAQTDSMGARD